MKLEEAIAKAKILNDSLKELADEYEGQGSFMAAGIAVTFKLVLDTILSALRPVSREQVERMRSRWITMVEVDGKQYSKCAACQTELDCLEDAYSFCPHCGVPMTDEAVEMVMERLGALNDAVD